MVWSARTIAEKLLRKPSYDQHRYDNEQRKAREREATLCKLARLHADRWNLSAEVARQHINQVSCTARRQVREELGLD
jgi:hypothetical protein